MIVMERRTRDTDARLEVYEIQEQIHISKIKMYTKKSAKSLISSVCQGCFPYRCHGGVISSVCPQGCFP